MNANSLAVAAVEIMERIEKEKKSLSANEIKLDGTNKVKFPNFPYTFEAVYEKIIVSLDIFKSGYECKDCLGTGKIVSKCLCTNSDRPGFKYNKEFLEQFRLEQKVYENRSRVKCSDCNGDPSSVEKELTCPTCKGKKALLVFPDDSKNLPSSGVVVSMGEVAREKARYHVGQRVLFSPHAGNMIPTKAGLMFKVLDWYQAWLIVDGASELGAFDFIIQDKEL